MNNDDSVFNTTAQMGVEVYHQLVIEQTLPAALVGAEEVAALACYLLRYAFQNQHEKFRDRYTGIPGCILIEVMEWVDKMLYSTIQSIQVESLPVELWEGLINRVKERQDEEEGFSVEHLADTIGSPTLAMELRAMIREEKVINILKRQK